eukprot:scaffold4423_cov105-Isochrysis_galbana.AAC.7
MSGNPGPPSVSSPSSGRGCSTEVPSESDPVPTRFGFVETRSCCTLGGDGRGSRPRRAWKHRRRASWSSSVAASCGSSRCSMQARRSSLTEGPAPALACISLAASRRNSDGVTLADSAAVKPQIELRREKRGATALGGESASPVEVPHDGSESRISGATFSVSGPVPASPGGSIPSRSRSGPSVGPQAKLPAVSAPPAPPGAAAARGLSSPPSGGVCCTGWAGRQPSRNEEAVLDAWAVQGTGWGCACATDTRWVGMLAAAPPPSPVAGACPAG